MISLRARAFSQRFLTSDIAWSALFHFPNYNLRSEGCEEHQTD
jgi:hypothetical protein